MQRGEAAAGASDEIVDRHRGLVGRTFFVAALTLVSRVLGFVREVLSAALFGDTSAIWDAFVTAWRVPNLFRRFFGEGAISTALQAALTEADGDGGNAAGRRLFRATARTMTLVLVGVSALAMVVALVLPDAVFGQDPAPVRELLLRLLPFVLLICMAALCAGALNVRGHFTAPNLAPSLMNVVWIAALLYVGYAYVWGPASPPAEVEALKGYQLRMARVIAWAALASGLVQILVQIPALGRHGFLEPTPAGSPEEARALRRQVRAVLWTSLPLALGAAVYQVNVMVDGFMAEAFLSDGGPSAYYFANRIQQFPLSLVALAATSAVFPALKALGHRERLGELRELHDRAQLGVCFLALPASAGLFVLADPIAAVLFEHGAYGTQGVLRIAATLRMLALAILPAGAVGLVSRTYYARGDFRTPVRASVAALVANILLNTFFLLVMDADVEGLALATALSAWGQLLWLLPGLVTKLGLPRSSAGAPRRIFVMAAAAVASGASAWLAFQAVAPAASAGRAAVKSPLGLLAGGLVGALVYFAAARVLGCPELREVEARVRGRLGRRR